ncbi:FRG domain-containing protein [Mameliella sp.]|uniref:FRG domain-containing protein n=1 Tax=Mameliella sp. TaxID=1924940 RepID=UPI003B506575
MPKGITSLTGYIRKLEKLREEKSGDLFFRGHSSHKFLSKPSVFRHAGLKGHERDMLLDLISESPREFDSDSLTFDKLVRAQHYGIPTRLLDVTSNPLMALYFACENCSDDRGQVIVYEIPRSQVKFFPSDAVSCKANLALLTENERQELRKNITSGLTKTYGKKRGPAALNTRRKTNPDKYRDFIDHWNTYPSSKRLAQFIKEEKPYFENRIDPIDILSIQAVIPKKNNARISAQAGAFLMFGLLEDFSEKTAKDIERSVIDITPSKKKEILQSLSAVGIHEDTVYPELDRLASKIKKRFQN